MAGLDLSALRVLAIDDNGFSRRLVMAALRALNVHQIAEAENAVDGFSALKSFSPDMILVDWVMPEVDGVEFARRVRGDKTGNFRFLPIIMTTSYSEIWRVQHARDVGINEFVVKPFSARTRKAFADLVAKFAEKDAEQVKRIEELFNVLKGEMSLVGPRPLPVDEVKRFDDVAHRRRLSVKPGLTCLWQISGRSSIGFDQWMKLDLEYIDHWSLGLDFKIILRTIPRVLLGKGAS